MAATPPLHNPGPDHSADAGAGMLRSVFLVSHLDLNLVLFRRALIEALLARGVAVFACAPKGPRAESLAALGATVLHYPLTRGSLSPLGLLRAGLALRRLVREHRPDIVHSFTHQPNLVARLAKTGRVHVINSVTGLGSAFLGSGFKSVLRRVALYNAYRFTAGRCRAMVFQNSDDKRYFELRSLSGDAKTVCIRGSGVDLARFAPGVYSAPELAKARAELGLGPGHVVCAMAARLVHDKGVREFLLAAQHLAKDLPQARFLLVGEPDPGNPGSLAPDDVAAFSRMPNVVFAGWREDMPRIWALSDAAVLPSYREGLPVSLQEAAAAGLPLIAADAPGCRDIALIPRPDAPPEAPEAAPEAAPYGNLGEDLSDLSPEDPAPLYGEHCILAPPGSWLGLAEAMRALIASKRLRQEMGQASRRKALRDFDADKLAQEHLALYAYCAGLALPERR